MLTVFKPKEIEEKWYRAWVEKGCFHGEIDDGKQKFSIVIPPPNVTGSLHMGHALNNSIQDILIRWKKMQGFATCWFPGTDHAGIATQMVVERELRKKEHRSRHDLGRESFVQQVWKWKEEFGGIIDGQLKKLGASCDWDRYSFTMDDTRAKAVKESFVRLHKKGYIYRDRYIVNWCPRCQTALSDLEVAHREDEPVGSLYHLRYSLLNAPEKFIVIATTRPETMLADVAVAVHPSDERYKHLIGKDAVLPLVGRKLKIVGDEWADPATGTGAVKITPAHDPNDFEVGKRHSLPRIVVIDTNGKMDMGEILQEPEIPDKTKDWLKSRYHGLDRAECRKKILEDLQQFKVLEKEEPWAVSPGRCDRCGEITEPYLSLQWFMRMKELAAPAIQVVREGKIKFFPSRFSKLYLDWMDSIRDWCLSRQLWWGHRIPAWYCTDCNPQVRDIHAKPIVSREAPAKCSVCGGKNLVQDEDVLDTWFSSALWPLSTMGWPESTPELKSFYPTDVLSTARDILYLWVARMIMMGLEFTGEIPFHDVYIHPTILDREGKRMSKSKGTGVDPLLLIEKYGADATRFGIVLMAQGQDVRYNEEKIEQARNFANKIWNASRFVKANLPDNFAEICDQKIETLKTSNHSSQFKFYDSWILSKLLQLVESVNKALSNHEYAQAASNLYDFFWDDFCDWYLELAKLDLQGQNGLPAEEAENRKTVVQIVLYEVLTTALKLLHPFMPFLTEEIWSNFMPGKTLLLESFWPPHARIVPQETDLLMPIFMDAAKGIRILRAEVGLKPKDKSSFMVKTPYPPVFAKIKQELMFLTQASEITILDETMDAPRKALSKQSAFGTLYLPFEGVLDLDVELTRLKKEREKIAFELQNVQDRLKAPDFVEKAKKEVVEKEQEKAKFILEKLNRVDERLKIFTT